MLSKRPKSPKRSFKGWRTRREQMFSQITPVEAATVIEDVHTMRLVDNLLRSISEKTVTSYQDVEGYLELRSIRERVATLRRRAETTLRRSFYDPDFDSYRRRRRPHRKA